MKQSYPMRKNQLQAWTVLGKSRRFAQSRKDTTATLKILLCPPSQSAQRKVQA